MHRKPPPFCQQGYLKKQGVTQNSQPLQDFRDTVKASSEQDAGSSDADSAFPKYLVQAGASLSSGLNLDI